MNQDISSKNQNHTFKFHGNGSEFFGIWIVNILLSCITLGIYSAWAKVRTNQYFYGNTELDGDRFEYLATPMQILIGRIIAVVLFIIWIGTSALFPLINAGLAVILMLCFPVLAARNIRFDARMTRFRNVRFDFQGSYGGAYLAFLAKPIGAYIIAFIGLAFVVSAVRFGNIFAISAAVLAMSGLFILAYGWVTAGIARYVANGYRYGDTKFEAKVDTGEYRKIALGAALIVLGAVALLALCALPFGLADALKGLNDSPSATEPNYAKLAALSGFVMVTYLSSFVVGMFVYAYVKASTRNYLLGQIRIDDKLSLKSTLPVKGFVGLIFTNMLITIFTLGLGRPWVDVRTARYLAEHTHAEGDMSFTNAQDHNAGRDSALADEMVDVFDLNIGVI